LIGNNQVVLADLPWIPRKLGKLFHSGYLLFNKAFPGYGGLLNATSSLAVL